MRQFDEHSVKKNLTSPRLQTNRPPSHPYTKVVLKEAVSRTLLMSNACRFEQNRDLFLLATSPLYSVTSMGQF
jgi:hypothetical protein